MKAVPALIRFPRIRCWRCAGLRCAGSDTTSWCATVLARPSLRLVGTCGFRTWHEDKLIRLPNARIPDGDSTIASSRALTMRLRVFMVESLEYNHPEIDSAINSRAAGIFSSDLLALMQAGSLRALEFRFLRTPFGRSNQTSAGKVSEALLSGRCANRYKWPACPTFSPYPMKRLRFLNNVDLLRAPYELFMSIQRDC